MAATRNYVLPAFTQKFEESQTYADFAAPTLAEIAPEVSTETADKKALAKNLCVLSSRIATALKRVTPNAAEMAAIKTLPTELQTPEGAMAAAVDADSSNATLKVWLATLQEKSEEEVYATAKAAYIEDPTDATLFALVLSEEFKKSETKGNPLEGSVTIEGESKTLAEWLSHGISLDEFNAVTWHFIAQLLGAIRNAERQMVAQRFQAIAAQQMQQAKDDEQRQQIQMQLMGAMQQAMQNHRPKISIGGQEFNGAMVAARMVQIREMHITKFGDDVVSSTRFATEPIPEKPGRARFDEACKLLAYEIDGNESVVVDVYENTAKGMISTGTKTVNEFSAIVEVLAADPSDASLWGSLANTLGLQKKASVKIGGKTVSILECATNACANAPTEERFWQLLMTVLVDAAKATVKDPENEAQLAAAVEALSVTIHGVTLPANAVMYLTENTPKTEQEFGQVLAQIQQELASHTETASSSSTGLLIALAVVGVACGVAGILFMKRKN